MRRRFGPVVALACGLAAIGALAAPVPYRTELPEVEDGRLQEALEAASNLLQLQDAEEPPGAAGLLRRAEDDRERMLAALRSFGYYAADVRVTIAGMALDTDNLVERLEAAAGQDPIAVQFEVELGPLYTIGKFEVLDSASGQEEMALILDREALGIAIGDPASAAAVLDAQTEVIRQMRSQGHPFAAVPDRRVVVDHATQQMEVTLTTAPGPYAVFGDIEVEGLEEVDEEFVRNRFPVTPGEPYSPEAVRELRDSLASLEAFAGVQVETGDELDADGRLPVTVHISERPPRVIGFGADYATSEGFGARVYWGHRNLFGRAESLRIQAEAGRIAENDLADIDFGLSVQLRVPDFLERQQTLRTELAIQRENPDAFRRQAVEATIAIDRPLTEDLVLSVGISGELSEVEDEATEAERLFLMSLPVSLKLDTTDDLLDPTEGVRATLSMEPFSVDRTFLRTELAASTYYDVFDDGDLVLAARTRLGSIVGEELLDVPNDKRFFAGGGGSIRGFAFQAVGPRTAADDPLGGRSVLELGFEARIRITEEIGIVPFIEGGTVYEEAFPSFSEPLRFGAGLGLRYYTDFGPLRLDVAVPINKQEGDDGFQFYVSIGQAF
ncbi:MAG: outer membrane protein assembly factor [Rhodospirillaceae bacterium]|nr:outer membrane protein assembly factor [Rhodospirillaceae bacterium]